jgi:hypothetical protein
MSTLTLTVLGCVPIDTSLGSRAGRCCWHQKYQATRFSALLLAVRLLDRNTRIRLELSLPGDYLDNVMFRHVTLSESEGSRLPGTRFPSARLRAGFANAQNDTEKK